MTLPPTAEPLGGDAVAERVRVLIDARRNQDALRLAREGLAADPTNADLMGLVGWILLDGGDARGAREWAERSLSIEPAAGWVHDLRARALLDGAGSPADALAAAQTAVQFDPDSEAFLFTLVGACLECRDRAGAQRALERLRQAAPESPLGLLAAAVLELDRGRAFLRQFTLGRLAVLTVLTQGTGVFLVGVWWLVQAVLRAPYLRRADVLLHDALQMKPDSASIRSIAAAVLRLRFRFAQSVDYEVAAAALDHGLIAADPLASSISRRTTTLAAVGSVVWVVGVALLDRLIGTDLTVALVGLTVAIGFVALIAGFDRWQTRSLPPLLLRNVRRRAPLLVTAAIATGWVAIAGAPYLWGAGQAARGYHLACLLAAPLALVATSALLVRFVAARRAV